MNELFTCSAVHQYSTVLIIQSVNLIEKHLRLEVGNSLVIPEAGNPETECEVTTSRVGVGKHRTGHFPSVSASVISKMSLCANLGLCWKTGAQSGRRKPLRSRNGGLGLLSSLGI